MESTFASEWQRLKEQRQQLIEETKRLQQEFASLTNDPSMKALLEEKNRLKKELPKLRDRIDSHDHDIEFRRNKLEKRRKALTDQRLQKELEVQLKQRRQRLTQMKEINAPKTILDDERKLIFELEAPIQAVEEHFQEFDAESRQQREAVQPVVNKTKERIADIDKHYRETKHALEEAIREVNEKRWLCRTEVIEWATQDREHLEWMLKYEPSYKDDIVRHYRARFPEDHLRDLFPPSAPLAHSVQIKSVKKRRLRTQTSATPPPAESNTTSPPKWRFWVTFSPHDVGQELPPEREQFLTQLRAALDAKNLSNLSVALVYDKLVTVSSMTVEQRRMIKKLSGDYEPAGWKIVRVGKKHRLFLIVDEEKRHIRFMPRHRKNAYSQH